MKHFCFVYNSRQTFIKGKHLSGHRRVGVLLACLMSALPWRPELIGLVEWDGYEALNMKTRLVKTRTRLIGPRYISAGRHCYVIFSYPRLLSHSRHRLSFIFFYVTMTAMRWLYLGVTYRKKYGWGNHSLADISDNDWLVVLSFCTFSALHDQQYEGPCVVNCVAVKV